MLMKSRLFASVAAPVLTLPLLIQPAAALPAGVGAVPTMAPAIVQVQQQVIPEEEGQGRERPRRERQNAEEQGGERPQRRQRAEEQQGEERPQRRQQQDAGQSQGEERPRRQQQRDADQQQGQERPQRRQQQDAGQSQGEERPRRQQQRDADQQQGQERPQRRQRQDAGQSQEQERPQRRQQQDAGQSQGEERPRRQQQRDADQQQGQERPQRSQQRDAAQPDGQERPRRQQQNNDQSQGQERPQRNQQSDSPQPQRRDGDRTGNSRSDNEPASQAPRPRDGEIPRSGNQQSQERDVRRDGQNGNQRTETPERQSGGERPPRAVQNNGEEPRLPVENGAAVLDSAKERPDRPRRDGDRPRRDANRQADERPVAPPRSDADAQANDRVTREQRDRWRDQRRELTEERGERLERRPEFERPRGWDVRGPARGGDRDRDNGRVIISIDNQAYVRHNDSRRFYRDGRQPEYERLGDGRYREVVIRDDGTRIVTIRNRYGEVVQRSRIVRGGNEYVLYYAPELLEDRRDYVWRDPGDDLPPMRLSVPIDDYIIDTSSEPDRDYYAFLEQPPVERVERVYSLDEVRYSARIRDKVPRIDLDTITFATGSAEIPMNQASSLRRVADAINRVLENDPSETFLIEGHTDAVGSDESNLVLSDERAESVAVVLSDAFGIPPENLTTQGYGERYLKVNTEAANQENRRVTIRRITPLVKPVASNQ